MGNNSHLTSLPKGLIDCPITPFNSENKVDFDVFGRVVEFLLGNNASALCINLHLAESLNLSLKERRMLAEAAVEANAGRVPVIINVSTPGTDHAVELARHAEKIHADAVMAIPPYYWKPPEDGIYEHLATILSATDLPFIGYSSPGIMDGVGISPNNLQKLIKNFPSFIGLKDASHNWEIFLELGRAARSLKSDFTLFVGTEWIVPSLTLGGTACMSVFGGIAPRFVKSLYDATIERDLDRALQLQFIYSELYQINKVEYPAPTKAMWEIMGRPVGQPRLPNRPFSIERVKELEGILDRLGLLNTEPKGW